MSAAQAGQGAGGRVAILIGSARENSASGRSAQVLAAELKLLGHETVFVDPRQLDLRMPGLEPNDELATELRALIESCEGVALITPEYDGSLSSAMKLMIEYLGYPSVLAGKPCIILGVASGRVGAMKAIEHLRSICDHIGAVVAPGSRTLAQVHNLFDERGQLTDEPAQSVVREVAANLHQFMGRYQSQ